jgi:hypothetical protein
MHGGLLERVRAQWIENIRAKVASRTSLDNRTEPDFDNTTAYDNAIAASLHAIPCRWTLSPLNGEAIQRRNVIRTTSVQSTSPNLSHPTSITMHENVSKEVTAQGKNLTRNVFDLF